MPIQIENDTLANFDDPIAMLHDCHRRIERFLDMLSSLSRERRGGELDEAGQSALAAALHYFDVGAPLHTADEEGSVFPRLRNSGVEEVRQLGERLIELENEHREKERRHREVHRLGTTWLVQGELNPEGARRFAAELERLERTYLRHIRIEEYEVFPVAAEVLHKDLLSEIANEMKERRGLPNERSG